MSLFTETLISKLPALIPHAIVASLGLLTLFATHLWLPFVWSYMIAIVLWAASHGLTYIMQEFGDVLASMNDSRGGRWNDENIPW